MATFNIIESSEILEHLDTLKLTLIVPKQFNGQTQKKGMASYVRHQITYNPGNGPVNIGYISVNDVITTDSMVDTSNQADSRNNSEFVGQIKYRIHSNASKCGDFGKIMAKLYEQWQTEIKRLNDSGLKLLGKRELTCGYSTHFIEIKDGIRTLGEKYEVPGIYFRIQPGQYPMNHPDRLARGCDRIEVYDLDISSEFELQRMTLDDGTQVNSDNLCKIISGPGIKLDCVVLDLSSTAYTSAYASWSLTITKIYMRKPIPVKVLPPGISRLLSKNSLPAPPTDNCEICSQPVCQCTA